MLRSLACLRRASGDESLTGAIADVLGLGAEEAAKALDEAAGKEEAEKKGEAAP